MELINQLKTNEKPFGLMSEEMQAKAREIGLTDNFRKYICSDTGGWGGIMLATGLKFRTDHAYRLRADYTDPDKDRVFSSTTDKELDDMNNTVGVTAHCSCGHVFTDDVVHGKSQAKPDSTAEDEYETLEIEKGVHGLMVRGPASIIYLHELIDDPRFSGFKYKDGNIASSPVMYSVQGSTNRGYFAPFEALKAGTAHIHKAIAVVFKKGI